jgi:hypothetical protein
LYPPKKYLLVRSVYILIKIVERVFTVNTTEKKIETLQQEIRAMQADLLLQEQYKEKIQELMKLRRSAVKKGKKNGFRSSNQH